MDDDGEIPAAGDIELGTKRILLDPARDSGGIVIIQADFTDPDDLRVEAQFFHRTERTFVGLPRLMRVEADTRKDSFILLGNFHGTSAVLQIRSRRDNERDTGFGGPA
jgi:hypothetical protein